MDRKIPRLLATAVLEFCLDGICQDGKECCQIPQDSILTDRLHSSIEARRSHKTGEGDRVTIGEHLGEAISQCLCTLVFSDVRFSIHGSTDFRLQ